MEKFSDVWLRGKCRLPTGRWGQRGELRLLLISPGVPSLPPQPYLPFILLETHEHRSAHQGSCPCAVPQLPFAGDAPRHTHTRQDLHRFHKRLLSVASVPGCVRGPQKRQRVLSLLGCSQPMHGGEAGFGARAAPSLRFGLCGPRAPHLQMESCSQHPANGAADVSALSGQAGKADFGCKCPQCLPSTHGSDLLSGARSSKGDSESPISVADTAWARGKVKSRDVKGTLPVCEHQNEPQLSTPHLHSLPLTWGPRGLEFLGTLLCSPTTSPSSGSPSSIPASLNEF